MNNKPKKDLPELAKLTQKAMNRRSVKNFSKISGVSESLLYSILNNNLRSNISQTSLSKIANASESRVTFKELLNSAGYTQNCDLTDNTTMYMSHSETQAIVIISDNISEIHERISYFVNKIRKTDIHYDIFVLVSKIDTVVLLQQSGLRLDNITLHYALIVH